MRNTMRAAVVREFGKPLTIEEMPIPTPGAGEVLIKKMSTQLYEYACHEANYALENTLRGARVAEAEAAKEK